MATVQSDIFQPTKFGGKYTSTLIPGEQLSLIPPSQVEAADLSLQATVSVLRLPSPSRQYLRRIMYPLSGSRSTSPESSLEISIPRSFSGSQLLH